MSRSLSQFYVYCCLYGPTLALWGTACLPGRLLYVVVGCPCSYPICLQTGSEKEVFWPRFHPTVRAPKPDTSNPAWLLPCWSPKFKASQKVCTPRAYMSLKETGTTVGSWSPRVPWLSTTILVTAHTHPGPCCGLGGKLVWERRS